MKNLASALVLLALLAAFPADLLARGGGGGRGFSGGGRGFSGGSHNFSSYGAGRGHFDGMAEHTPSMSRSSSFNPGASSYRGAYGNFNRGGEGFGTRPSAGDLGHFLNMPQGGVGGVGGAGRGVGNIGGAGGVAGAGRGVAAAGGTGAAGRVAGAGNIAGSGRVAGNVGNQAGNRNVGNRVNNLSPQQTQHAQNIRNNIQGNHNNWYNNHGNWYNHSWWGNHGGAWNHGWNYWHGWGPGAWWNGAGWGALTGFMVGSWASPMYYGYGSGGNVAYQGDNVYVNGQDAGTTQQYYDQAQQIASTPVPDDAANGDWMPLGVFSVSSRADDDHPVMMMQLAVSKQGNIAGMYYNTSDDVSLPIQGAVDQKTQRAAWTVGDKKNTVLETGIFNLTKDETSVLVHFGDQKTQDWLMVRLNKPETGSQDVFGPAPGSTSNQDEKPAPGLAAPSDS